MLHCLLLYFHIVVYISHRFFSSCSSQVRTTESGSDCDSSFCATQQSPPIQRNNSSVPALPSQNTPSPPSSQCSAYPRTASRGMSSFYWAGVTPSSEQSRKPTLTSGLVALQRFHYKKEISTKTNRSAGETTPTRLSTIQKDDLPDPLPTLDRVYFPWSKTDMVYTCSLHSLSCYMCECTVHFFRLCILTSFFSCTSSAN